MNKTHESYAQAFASDNPEVGTAESGTTMTAESAAQFGAIMRRRVLEVSRQFDITPAERTLVERTADLGARNVAYLLDRGYKLPDMEGDYEDNVRNWGKAISARTGEQLPEDFGVSESATSHALGRVTGGSFTMGEGQVWRGRVEDAAMSGMPVFGAIAAHNESLGNPIVVDDYLEGNLRELMSQYEMAE